MQAQGEGFEGAQVETLDHIATTDDGSASDVAVVTDKAATAVEYGIMIAAIAGVVIAVVIAVGGQVDSALFQKVFENMQSLPD
jgi:Flp pilus assembly pilin Flp